MSARLGMISTLKPFGRPSRSGLSVKELGVSEYHRRRYLLIRKPAIRTPSKKLLGEAEYMRRRRAAARALISHFASRFLTGI